jgi:hypothetical protein
VVEYTEDWNVEGYTPAIQLIVSGYMSYELS